MVRHISHERVKLPPVPTGRMLQHNRYGSFIKVEAGGYVALPYEFEAKEGLVDFPFSIVDNHLSIDVDCNIDDNYRLYAAAWLANKGMAIESVSPAYIEPRLNGSTYVVLNDEDKILSTNSTTGELEWADDITESSIGYEVDATRLASEYGGQVELFSSLEVDVVPMREDPDEPGSETVAEYEDDVESWSLVAKITYPLTLNNHDILSEVDDIPKGEADEQATLFIERVLPFAELHIEDNLEPGSSATEAPTV
jgi:hypothetical protein